MEENTSKVFVGRSASALLDPMLAVTASEPGTSLFVINLCASIAPVQTGGKTMPGFEAYKLYQVARVEDGRTRHRLRLGFFTTEADAEQALVAVRDNYPTAFVTCLSNDDRRYARGYLPDTSATASLKRPMALVEKPAVVPAATTSREPAPKPVAQTPAAGPTAAPISAQPEVRPATPVAAPKESPSVAVNGKPEARSVAPTKPAATSTPAAPAAMDSGIELSWDPPALQPTKPAASAAASAVPTTIAPTFRTESVIKSAPAEPQTKAVKPPVAPSKAPATGKVAAPMELSLANESAPIASSPSQSPDQPFHVGKGADIPVTALSLEASGIRPAAMVSAPVKPEGKAPAAKSASRPAAAPASVAAAEPVRKTPATGTASSSATPARAAAPTSANARVPELDTTQTIRALTSDELNDEEKWFAIQLVVSEQPVNLDAMPHLDIFEAYRVYSVANAGSGKIVYSLRLGFFREEVSANAVGGYLKTFFPSPSTLRISTAEQLRFKDAPAPKATTVKSEARIVELNQARDRKPTIPTVTMEVSNPSTDRSPTGAFRTSTSGSFKVNASGTHKALNPAARSAVPAARRSAPLSKTSHTGRHKTLQQQQLQKKSLQEQLLDEARDVQLSESAIRKLPKSDSLLSRLVGKLTR